MEQLSISSIRKWLPVRSDIGIDGKITHTIGCTAEPVIVKGVVDTVLYVERWPNMFGVKPGDAIGQGVTVNGVKYVIIGTSGQNLILRKEHTMKYASSDGTIGTMVPDDQVPECWGGTNPDADGDLWLQVEGEKSARVVAQDQCSAAINERTPWCEMREMLQAVGYTVYKPGEVPMQQQIETLRTAGYTVLSPVDTVARARTLMIAVSTAMGTPTTTWTSGTYDECAVKAYTYLLEWARSQ